jgi:hypothetical protein
VVLVEPARVWAGEISGLLMLLEGPYVSKLTPIMFSVNNRTKMTLSSQIDGLMIEYGNSHSEKGDIGRIWNMSRYAIGSRGHSSANAASWNQRVARQMLDLFGRPAFFKTEGKSCTISL